MFVLLCSAVCKHYFLPLSACFIIDLTSTGWFFHEKLLHLQPNLQTTNPRVPPHDNTYNPSLRSVAAVVTAMFNGCQRQGEGRSMPPDDGQCLHVV